jgi:hypothetical protein
MPRLRNDATGVVVEVSDETAALLGSEYQPEEKKATRSSAKSDSK